MKHNAPSHLLAFYLAWDLNPNDSSYNLTFSYCLSDYKSTRLIADKLQALIKEKAYLRQTFSMEENNLVATIHKDLPAKIHFYKRTKKNLHRLEEQLRKESHQINQESSIILNVIDIEDSPNEYWLLFNIHHIIINSPSLDRFIDDLNKLLADKPLLPESR